MLFTTEKRDISSAKNLLENFFSEFESIRVNRITVTEGEAFTTIWKDIFSYRICNFDSNWKKRSQYDFSVLLTLSIEYVHFHKGNLRCAKTKTYNTQI